MKLHEKIKLERKRRNLSREKLKKLLLEITGLSVSLKTIQRWEDGVLPNLIELQCLSEFLEVKISDLLDEKKDLSEISRNEFYSFGETLLAYSMMDNLADLMDIYYITKKNNVRFNSVPRYDIELHGANSLLSHERDYHESIRFINLLFEWMERCERTTNKNRVSRIFVHDDPVGSRSYFDPRTILNTEEILMIKDGIISELHWFNQEVSEYLYDKNNEKVISNLNYIKRKTFS